MTAARLRSSRNGEAGIRGGPTGDLYVVIHVREHEIFTREDDDLYCDIPISFSRPRPWAARLKCRPFRVRLY